jgi:hypothetical protein
MTAFKGVVPTGCRSCGSMAIAIPGEPGPQAIVRCGNCSSVLSTWRTYLARLRGLATGGSQQVSDPVGAPPATCR